MARTAPWLAEKQTTDALTLNFDIESGYLYGRDSVHADPRTTRGLPGSRIPHYWLEKDGKAVSTIDLTGQWLLLDGPEGTQWSGTAKSAAHSFADLPLDAWQVGTDLADPTGQFATSVGISAAGAILVRPDGFVAWRAKELSGMAEKALAEAISSILR